MKKKLFAIILSVAILLSTVAGLSEVSFAQDEKYVLSVDGGNDKKYNNVDDLVEAVNAISDTKSYTLTLKDDLVLPKGASNSNVKTLQLKNDMLIDGRGYTISLGEGILGGTMITVKNANLEIKDTILDGAGKESANKARGIEFTGGDDNTLKLSGSKLINCYAEKEAGALLMKGGNLIIENTGFENNNIKKNFNSSHPVYAGAIKSDNCKSVYIKDSWFEDNEAEVSKSSGALTILDCQDVKINNTTFKKNRGYESYVTGDLCSGAALASENSKINLSNVTIEENLAMHKSEACSGVSIKKCELNIEDGIFKNNKSYSRRAECIAALDSEITINNTVFTENGVFESAYTGEHTSGAACIYTKKTDLKVSNSKFANNAAIYYGSIRCEGGGAIDVYNTEFTRNKSQNGSIYATDMDSFNAEKLNVHHNNFERTDWGLLVYAEDITLKDSNVSDNNIERNGEGGAFLVAKNTMSVTDSTFINNYGTSNGAGLRLSAKNATIKGCSFINNHTTAHGGGLCIGDYNGDNKVKISDSKFINNSALEGGAIFKFYDVWYLYRDNDPQNTKAYENLNIEDDVIFRNNYASKGFYSPPINYKDFNKNLKYKEYSLKGKLMIRNKDNQWEQVDSLLNNYDLNYTNPKLYTMYFANNGSNEQKEFELKTPSEPRYYYNIFPFSATIKTYDELDFKATGKFKGWNTKPDGSGTSYKGGEKLNLLYGNFYLYAQWEKPQEYTILTLDENYSGGKITEKELLVGDLIEPHLYKPKRRGFTFKGWSYNKKHLDKVHYDDRIYEDTTVYAIWDEVEEEPEEIKGMTHKAYIFGYPDGTVRPDGKITRAEAAAMLARLLEIESIGSAEAPSFPDTPSAWYNKAINAVVQRGIMKGYPDGTFKPNDAITRAEFTQMISTIDNKPYGTAPFADVVGHWAERPIGSEYQAGRILGYPDGTFRPDAHITRCEAAVILNKIFERNFDAMSLLKCKNPMMIKYFIDLDASFWGYNDMVEATNDHEYIRRTTNRVAEDWLEIK